MLSHLVCNIGADEFPFFLSRSNFLEVLCTKAVEADSELMPALQQGWQVQISACLEVSADSRPALRISADTPW